MPDNLQSKNMTQMQQTRSITQYRNYWISVNSAPELSPQEKAEREKLEREENIKADNATLEVILTDLTQATEAAVSAATTAQKSLVDAVKKHTELMKSALEDEIEVSFVIPMS